MSGPFESQAYGITNFDGTVTDSKTGTVYPNAQAFDNSLIRDSGDDAISKLAKDLNIKLSDESKDYLYQYYFQEQQNKSAWQRTMEADNTRYQRTAEDLRKAGINPFMALQSLSPSSQSSSAGSVSSGYNTQQKNVAAQNRTDIATKLMTIFGIIAAAVIYAL